MGKFLMTIFIDPVLSLLRQGITPEELAAGLALGITLGIFPIIGVTTVLCAAVAVLFRLNLAVIQTANWIAYPLQIILIAPFFIIGAMLFGPGAAIHQGSSIMPLLSSDLFSTLQFLGDTAMKAVFAWALAAPFMIAIIYWSIKPVLSMFLKRE